MGEKIRTTIYLTEELRTKMFTERAISGKTITDVIIEAVEKYYEEKEGIEVLNRNYYYYSPRGFGNEYTIFVVEVGSEAEGRLLDWLGEQSNDVNTRWEKISRHQAVYYCRKYHGEAKAWGEECYGGLVCPWDPTLSDDGNFQAAIAATKRFLDEQDDYKQEFNWDEDED